ncbi:MAG TPA: (2Fe-2S)-binding protein [Pseudomonadales bacterium]|nr:(2Fe-2S)-binding protein [Pseudomonadales bacterium]
MIEFFLNGKPVAVDMEADTPLLWALREGLQKTGTKFGCGQGLCGACTVLINGNPTRSCVLPVTSIAGQKITTIEGLHGNHAVQQAWLEENVSQCGYCQPGQIMSAVGLLSNNANPTDEDILIAMTGNICRCGTYPRIVKAIKVAAKKLQQANEFQVNELQVNGVQQ